MPFLAESHNYRSCKLVIQNTTSISSWDINLLHSIYSQAVSSTALFPRYPISLLCTNRNHLSLSSLTLSLNCSTCAVPLTRFLSSSSLLLQIYANLIIFNSATSNSASLTNIIHILMRGSNDFLTSSLELIFNSFLLCSPPPPFSLHS